MANTIEQSYSAIWFNPNNFRVLDCYKERDDVSFLEIGSFEGYGTNYFVNTFLTGNSSTITCVDPWIKYSESTVAKLLSYDNIINEHTYDIFLKNTSANIDKIKIKRGLSVDILPTLKNESYDFIYVDGDHSEKAVWLDAILSFKLLKIGGIMIFDDYLWNEGERSPRNAIDKFLLEYKDRIQVLNIGYQVSIKKVAN